MFWPYGNILLLSWILLRRAKIPIRWISNLKKALTVQLYGLPKSPQFYLWLLLIRDQVLRVLYTVHSILSTVLSAVSVLGQDEGYTVKYSPSPEGTSKSKDLYLTVHSKLSPNTDIIQLVWINMNNFCVESSENSDLCVVLDVLCTVNGVLCIVYCVLCTVEWV